MQTYLNTEKHKIHEINPTVTTCRTLWCFLFFPRECWLHPIKLLRWLLNSEMGCNLYFEKYWWRAGAVAKLVECLLCMWKGLGSTASTAKREKRKEKGNIGLDNVWLSQHLLLLFYRHSGIQRKVEGITPVHPRSQGSNAETSPQGFHLVHRAIHYPLQSLPDSALSVVQAGLKLFDAPASGWNARVLGIGHHVPLPFLFDYAILTFVWSSQEKKKNQKNNSTSIWTTAYCRMPLACIMTTGVPE
jgi:hypothetical protein